MIQTVKHSRITTLKHFYQKKSKWYKIENIVLIFRAENFTNFDIELTKNEFKAANFEVKQWKDRKVVPHSQRRQKHDSEQSRRDKACLV